MKNDTAYAKQQMLKVCPVIVEDCGSLRIKVMSHHSSVSKSNWMDITPKQFRDIEKILCGE